MNRILPFFIAITALLLSCKKEWLKEKSNKSLLIPTNIEQLQSLLDNTSNIFTVSHPSLGVIGSDDYYITSMQWKSLYNSWQKKAYVWAPNVEKEPYYGQDWNASYQRILYSNVVLEAIDKVVSNATNIEQWKNVKGTALFCRSFDFFNLSQIFAKPYNDATADSDLGIPLRLTADVNEKVERGTLKNTYDQILDDLIEAKRLLPSTQQFKTRPTKASAYALLSRIYLSMGDYKNSKMNADSALTLSNTLLDYNIVDSSTFSPLSTYDDEVLYHFSIFYDEITYIASVDSTLLKSYKENDLRRSLYFVNNSGNFSFRGTYDYSSFFMSAALTTDELYLISAECSARSGNIQLAMSKLNSLLVNRYRTGAFTPEIASSQEEALKIILAERRKELVFRGTRWSDLRRLNNEGANITITRNIDGQLYNLTPNDKRYVWPLPESEVKISNIPQNEYQ